MIAPANFPTAIWVNSDLASDEESYVATIHFNDDLSFPLTEEEGLTYASAVLRACASAEYDAAMLAQLTGKLKMPERMVGPMLVELREQRGPGTWQAGPLILTPGVSVFNRAPFLRCEVPGDLTWQWSPAEAKQHARHVLEVAAAVEYDAAYRAFLIDKVGIEPERALNVVGDIANFRTEEDK